MQIEESYVPCRRSKIVIGSKVIFIFLKLYQKLQMPSTFMITLQFSHGLDMDMVLAFQCNDNFGNINMSKPIRMQKGQIRHKMYPGCRRETELFQEDDLELQIIHDLREDIVTHRRLSLIKMEMMIHSFTKCTEGTKQNIGHIKRPQVLLSLHYKRNISVPKDR